MNSAKHLLSTAQFTAPEEVYALFATADHARTKQIVRPASSPLMNLDGKIIVTAFYENSTRTRCSFEAAALRLGGQVITETFATSSQSKNERLEDSVRTLSQYGDALVLRHPEIGAVGFAAEFSKIPVINAGDGAGEHPTQALADLYTVFRHRGEIDNGFSVMFCGDLRDGRTVHSWLPLVKLLGNVKVFLAANEGMSLSPHLYQGVENVVLVEQKNIKMFLPAVDVLYMTRVQEERKDRPTQPEASGFFKLRPEIYSIMKKSACVLHPLPRNSEIHPDCDAHHASLYHTEQVKNGLYLRMAVLHHVLRGDLFR